jgi:hypothetical protein
MLGNAATATAAAVPPVPKSAEPKTAVPKTAVPKTAEPNQTAPKAAMKPVVYRGYQFLVPAGWPVYRLDQHPSLCVRYDVAAVYLGTPGANMRCPAGLIGRTQAVSFIPSANVAAGSGPELTPQRAQPGATGVPAGGVPAVRGKITRNAAQHELRIALGTAALGVTLIGTYGADPAVIEQILGSLRTAPAGAAVTRQSGFARQLGRPSAGRGQPVARRAAGKAAQSRPAQSRPAQSRPAQSRPAQSRPAQSRPAQPSPAQPSPAHTAQPAPVYTSWRGVPAHWPVQIVQQNPPTFRAVFGFDTCTAPPLSTMKVWRKKYAAAGIYIGGVNAACSYGNLSAGWVRSAAAMGYGFLPTYVGPQAPCWNGRGVLIDPAKAKSEGTAAASDAVRDARLFGLPQGSPIFYDMEAYVGGAGCKAAVLSFISAWDRRLAASGYTSGAYSSQDSGIDDLQAATAGKTAGFTPPAAIWIALWDNVASLDDGTLAWPLSRRVKQYAGNITDTVGGIMLDIDKDVVGGPLAR